ncbi:metal-binding protein ZinT [Macrococcus equi]|uniref:metal-binding protein ZinT n=1 Tax=Macrococcus equi TaxID=3395462 RepID=UPI0039BDB092
MKKNIFKGLSVISFSILIAGCQNPGNNHEEKNKAEVQEHHHEHQHAMTKSEQNIYKGIFKDKQVKDRNLSDWEGDWQSVYPYLKDGTLDDVFKHKAKEDESKTAKEYKAYYTKGYQTDINRIHIDGSKISFYKGNDKSTGEYGYDGKVILKYEAGNRGVRYLFKKLNGDENAPKFIQFSDHIIAPEKALHFHIYMGNDKDKLLKEMEHWPTYYPSDLKGQEIKEEMLGH